MTPPSRPSKRRPWWLYLVFALAAFGLLLTVGIAGGVFWLGSRFLPRYAKIPLISGRVVDTVTGKPVPGMDVCLLSTYIDNGPTDGTGHSLRVKRSQVARTDAFGTFAFAASNDSLDLFETWDDHAPRGGFFEFRLAGKFENRPLGPTN